MWNAEKGYFYDYDLTTKQPTGYEYITGFYPLWAGLASPAQAQAMEKHLAVFEREGGVMMSTTESGTQWDEPYGWAPTNWLAVAGLERYGFHEDAARISRKFMATVERNYAHDGTIREKYNVMSGSANVRVAAGYKANVIGFGWTNGVYLRMNDLVAGRQESAAVGAQR
jgi:alpha,alpha-trehalase